jgi:hypothetical protein
VQHPCLLTQLLGSHVPAGMYLSVPQPMHWCRAGLSCTCRSEPPLEAASWRRVHGKCGYCVASQATQTVWSSTVQHKTCSCQAWVLQGTSRGQVVTTNFCCMACRRWGLKENQVGMIFACSPSCAGRCSQLCQPHRHTALHAADLGTVPDLCLTAVLLLPAQRTPTCPRASCQTPLSLPNPLTQQQ